MGLNNLYGWVMSQKLPLGGFKWVEETSHFNEHFIKSYNKDSGIGYLIEAVVQYPKKLHELLNDLPFFRGGFRVYRVSRID